MKRLCCCRGFILGLAATGLAAVPLAGLRSGAAGASAWRDLAELVGRQAIEPIGQGRSRAYRLHWPGEPMPGDGP